MPVSLYSILKPLVDTRKTGTLQIKHDNGDNAVILLNEGRIKSIKVGSQTGADAGKSLSMWLSFATEFSEKPHPPSKDTSGLDTRAYLSLLAKIEQRLNMILNEITLNSTSLKVVGYSSKENKKFSPEEIKILLAIDGTSSVQQIVSRSKLPEIRALNCIYKFCRLGLVKQVSSHSPLDEAGRGSLLAAITEFLSDQVGPVAEVLVNDAFEYLESDPKLIYRSELPQLIETISKQLDQEDSMVFKKWAFDSWKSLMV